MNDMEECCESGGNTLRAQTRAEADMYHYENVFWKVFDVLSPFKKKEDQYVEVDCRTMVYSAHDAAMAAVAWKNEARSDFERKDREFVLLSRGEIAKLSDEEYREYADDYEAVHGVRLHIEDRYKTYEIKQVVVENKEPQQ